MVDSACTISIEIFTHSHEMSILSLMILNFCPPDIYIRKSNYKVLDIQIRNKYVTSGFHHPKAYLDSINDFLDVKIRKQT